MNASTSDALLQRLADQGRRVLVDWRAVLLLRQATFELPPRQRRWRKLPGSVSDIRPILRHMVQREELKPIQGHSGLFLVMTPYAQLIPVDEREVLFDVHPYGALSHASALIFHGLSDDFPRQLTVTTPRGRIPDLLPLDTTATDWEDIPLPSAPRPQRVYGQEVTWKNTAADRFFGYREYRLRTYPIRVMTPERTLLDGLREPALCGGFETVLGAWQRASTTINLDLLIEYVDRLEIGLLRQRVGFVLESLGLHHPTLDQWAKIAHRGGSSRLVGGEPFAPTFSERWALSINAPIHRLRDAML